MNIIKCPSCGKGWDIDLHNACMCGAAIVTRKAPQNLPKADAYSLLAEVRAMIDEVLPLLAREDLWDDGGVIFNAHQIIYNFKCEHFS